MSEVVAKMVDMDQNIRASDTNGSDTKLSRQQASDAVTDLGWRYILGVLCAHVPVTSLARAADLAARAAAAAGEDADGHLWMDVRRDRLVLRVQTLALAWPTTRDVALARRVSEAIAETGLRTEGGLRTEAGVGDSGARSVQLLEIAIDALDIAAIRPFWKAVLGYTDEADATGTEDPLVDPLGHGPAIWFQQMDAPRPQRNRIHFDVAVPHDEAAERLRATLAAGGVLVSDAAAPAFWVLADVEGNEACICTWQGRDG
jgi:4a-hydroxytetrahydrobiopterin dehydratase